MAKVKVTESKLRGEITIHCNLLEDEETLKLVKENEPEAKIIPLTPKPGTTRGKKGCN